jgi:hypothetical protein
VAIIKEISRLVFTEPEHEEIAKSANHGFTLEAGQARAQHELHSRDELRNVWTQSEESGDAELLEEGVAWTPSGCTWLTWCAISRIGVTAVAGPPSPPLFVRREFLEPPSWISCAYVGCDYSL